MSAFLKSRNFPADILLDVDYVSSFNVGNNFN